MLDRAFIDLIDNFSQEKDGARAAFIEYLKINTAEEGIKRLSKGIKSLPLAQRARVEHCLIKLLLEKSPPSEEALSRTLLSSFKRLFLENLFVSDKVSDIVLYDRVIDLLDKANKDKANKDEANKGGVIIRELQEAVLRAISKTLAISKGEELSEPNRVFLEKLISPEELNYLPGKHNRSFFLRFLIKKLGGGEYLLLESKNFTAFARAAFVGDCAAVKHYLKRKTFSNEELQQALELASINSNIDVIREIFNKYPEILSELKLKGKTPSDKKHYWKVINAILDAMKGSFLNNDNCDKELILLDCAIANFERATNLEDDVQLGSTHIVGEILSDLSLGRNLNEPENLFLEILAILGYKRKPSIAFNLLQTHDHNLISQIRVNELCLSKAECIQVMEQIDRYPAAQKGLIKDIVIESLKACNSIYSWDLYRIQNTDFLSPEQLIPLHNKVYGMSAPMPTSMPTSVPMSTSNKVAVVLEVELASRSGSHTKLPSGEVDSHISIAGNVTREAWGKEGKGDDPRHR